MPLLLRRDKGVKLTKDELDNNLVFLKDYTNLINKKKKHCFSFLLKKLKK